MHLARTDEKVALVTGSAKRIGAAIVRHLHQAGFKVLIHYHKSQEEAHFLAKSLNEIRPNSAFTIQQNLEEEAALENIIHMAIDWSGRLDVLVNNASVFIKDSESCWDVQFQLNLKVPYLLSHYAYPHLQKREGAIINISDIHAVKPLKDYAIYCQTKAALNMQTKALAKAFAPKVRVNAVAPGAIAWPEGANALDKTRKEKIIAQTALQRHGDPLYIAQAVLAFVENSFITGEILRVDGGRGVM